MSSSTRRNQVIAVETLENRALLHGFGFGRYGGGGFGWGDGGSWGRGGFGGGFGLNQIEFSQAPSAVQTGLDKLATTDGLTPPATTSTQTVYLGNSNGVETYTIFLTGTGTQSALTVDQTGAPVTAPTQSTTTDGALPTAVATEASAIATALGLTVPTSTTDVHVTTPSGGTAVYSIRLLPSSSSSSSSTPEYWHGRTVQIDANGNPVGNQNLPFSVIPSTIQTALNTNRPNGATALATTSTQNVSVRTNNGITTYSTTFTTTGTSTTVTVNAAGALTKLPSHSTTTFSALSTTLQTALNTLANDNGVSGTISSTATVYVYDEANGTTIYSVIVNGSKTGFNGKSFTYNLTISVDQNGNPTTLPSDSGGTSGDNSGYGAEFGSSFGGFGGFASFDGFGFFGRRHH